MISKPYYYNTIRKIVVAFGNIFNELSIDRVNSEGQIIRTIQIPLSYTPKEKFVRLITEYSKIDDNTHIQETLPRMGFELTSLEYAPERKTNTMEKIVEVDGDSTKYMFNRVPYNLGFSLYIATRKLDDAFRIVEQILPYFTPELTVKIIDKGDYNISTNVPYILTSTNFEITSDGSPEDDQRSVVWELNFTAKAYLYAATRDSGVIKKTIVDINNTISDQFLEQYVASVDPVSANPDDEYNISESFYDSDYVSGVINNYAGYKLDPVTLSDG